MFGRRRVGKTYGVNLEKSLSDWDEAFYHLRKVIEQSKDVILIVCTSATYWIIDNQVINVCEMKYTENEYAVDKNFDKAMRRKNSDFIKSTKTKYSIHTILISANEVMDNSYSGNLQSIITSEDLFKDESIR